MYKHTSYGRFQITILMQNSFIFLNKGIVH